MPMITLKDFLKPSYEAIEREREVEEAKNIKKLFDLLETDGADVAKSIIDFLSSAFVGIADGAQQYEFHKLFENVEIYINFKKRGYNE